MGEPGETTKPQPPKYDETPPEDEVPKVSVVVRVECVFSCLSMTGGQP